MPQQEQDPRIIKKWIITASFVGYATYIVYLIADALRQEPVEDGFKKILADPWALSALFDYVASLSLGASFLAARSVSPPGVHNAAYTSLQFVFAVLTAAALTCLGNPVLLVVAGILLIPADSIESAWLTDPSTAAETESQRQPLIPGRRVVQQTRRTQTNLLGLYIFRAIHVVNLVAYVAIVGRALYMESPFTGWERITAEPWSWLTFVDSFGGVVFSIVYIVTREWGRSHIWVPFVLALLVAGNGAGIVYMLLATVGASSIHEAVLSAQPLVMLD